MEAQIRMINVDQLVPNKAQPRTQFDTASLQELASSIRSHGIVQPLIVRRLQDKFEIIAGERRLKAAELLGLQSVPCIICDIDDNESSELALVENIHRKDDMKEDNNIKGNNDIKQEENNNENNNIKDASHYIRIKEAKDKENVQNQKKKKRKKKEKKKKKKLISTF
jgi:ParB/RepB/Spo0J family partition protein